MSSKLQDPPFKVVPGVIALDQSKQTKEGFPSLLGAFTGKSLLLSPDRTAVVAISDSPEAIQEFKKVNDLKTHVLALAPRKNQNVVK